MKKQALRHSLLTMALAVSALAWGPGTSQAYLNLNPLGQPRPIVPGDTPDYLTTPNWANSPPLRKFVDYLPGVKGLTTYNTGTGYDANGANNLGQIIDIAVPDITTYPGSDYYVIQLDEYSEKMHTDLVNPTRQRGYHQTNNGTNTTGCTDPSKNLANPCTTAQNTVIPPVGQHHLGPIIVAQKDRPVRVKFVNHLPTTQSGNGNLFIPVDTSIMGAGSFFVDYDPETKLPINPPLAGNFSQNRATLHLHGGTTPWISDGTPHQWITPAGEATTYPRGVSVQDVSDMEPTLPGEQTFYWTNQQSARLMFYHDHAWGITRLNVYVGEAAGYLIQDPTEIALITSGIIPADQIPLVIEDKTFVDPATIDATDPTWNWGTGTAVGGIRPPVKGDLWWPHIYMPAQNPFDVSGIAPMGRWAYGPWFWPPTNGIQYPPINNPYFNALCDTLDPTQNEANTLGYTTTATLNPTSFCQPNQIPGTPNPSWGAEAFMDTPLVNGTAYPVLKVDPKAYRMRILNAAHDRFYNLQFYQADTSAGAQASCPGCVANSEVRMVPALDFSAVLPTDPQWPSVGTSPQPATWAADGRVGGAPDWNLAGPGFIQIGTEGGFLPKPVVLSNNPVTWNNDPTTFNMGNVSGGTLILGSAERADVIVDFSAYAGKTLILYNDSPAPFPALDPHYDYFTGAPDMTDAGGAASTIAGMGPNTRTIMQIQVAAGTGVPFTAAQITKLNDAFATGNNSVGGAALTPTGKPVFAEDQHPIIVGQTAYNNIYAEGTLASPSFPLGTPANPTFPKSWPNWGVSRIGDNAISYEDVAGGIHTLHPMEPKAIHDEMGAVFDDYGRLSAKLGLEMAVTPAGVKTFVMQNYVDPVTEVISPNQVQIWKITHNGVDTHPLHFHLYDVQVLNRVGWDGFIRLPELNELGWKDTVRISPLEDTIVALRPITPLLPFGVPESIRPMNPQEPLNSTADFTTIDPVTGQARNPAVKNVIANYDWEYVVHCHILSHEESDMMRTQVYLFQEKLPPNVQGLVVTTAGSDKNLAWTDPTPATALATQGNPANEIGFIIERAVGTGPFLEIGSVPANHTTFTDLGAAQTVARYRVIAHNAAGESPGTDSIGVFRPSTGRWYLDLNGNGKWNIPPADRTFGAYGGSSDIPLVGDWDGDGASEVGVYRPGAGTNTGMWYLDLNGNGLLDAAPADLVLGPYGNSSDIPIVGDWNGDGKSEIGLCRPGISTTVDSNLWYLDLNGNGVSDDLPLGPYGIPTDKPIAGDWNGDGKSEIGVSRPGASATVDSSLWFLDMNGNGKWNGTVTDSRLGPYGIPTDIPIVGDWNGDGKSEIGVSRPGTSSTVDSSIWYLDLNGNGKWNNSTDLRLGPWGTSTDKPIIGHW